MSPETLFSVANAVALVGWIILALAPVRRLLAIAAARVIGVGLAVTYAVLLIRSLIGGGFEGDLTTLAGLTAAFARPEAVLVGWVHYLAFDLWVGAWATEDAGKRGLPHWVLLPCLFFILMAGPFGLLLYLAARTALSRRAA
ncbi:ABA4-like family protein [Brevundimonas bacteroides]|uniref:ABA4-like family protein n=1 Tax=Brevundimonas bacteroides TaxID=74311 RepID=UPI0004959BC7|nr:ABA4-like family protein [Brevundimonas bacteroides]